MENFHLLSVVRNIPNIYHSETFVRVGMVEFNGDTNEICKKIIPTVECKQDTYIVILDEIYKVPHFSVPNIPKAVRITICNLEGFMVVELDFKWDETIGSNNTLLSIFKELCVCNGLIFVNEFVVQNNTIGFDIMLPSDKYPECYYEINFSKDINDYIKATFDQGVFHIIINGDRVNMYTTCNLVPMVKTESHKNGNLRCITRSYVSTNSSNKIGPEEGYTTRVYNYRSIEVGNNKSAYCCQFFDGKSLDEVIFGIESTSDTAKYIRGDVVYAVCSPSITNKTFIGYFNKEYTITTPGQLTVNIPVDPLVVFSLKYIYKCGFEIQSEPGEYILTISFTNKRDAKKISINHPTQKKIKFIIKRIEFTSASPWSELENVIRVLDNIFIKIESTSLQVGNVLKCCATLDASRI